VSYIDAFMRPLFNLFDPLFNSLKFLGDFTSIISKNLELTSNGVETISSFVRGSVALMLVVREWPEIAEIILKIFRGERLSGCDEAWMREIAEETGWNEDDVFEKLRNFNVDPSMRAEKYEGLFEKYYREAIEIVGKDARQAGEKMCGAVTALIKLHATKRGIPIIHWDHGKLYNYVNNNVRGRERELFETLLLKAEKLHHNFYEADLDEITFKKFFNDVVNLIKMLEISSIMEVLKFEFTRIPQNNNGHIKAICTATQLHS